MPKVEEDILYVVCETPDLDPVDFSLRVNSKSLVHPSVVDDVETLQNRSLTGFQTIPNVPGICDLRRTAMTLQAETCTEEAVGHILKICCKAV
jgi:hypothetical protein